MKNLSDGCVFYNGALDLQQAFILACRTCLLASPCVACGKCVNQIRWPLERG